MQLSRVFSLTLAGLPLRRLNAFVFALVVISTAGCTGTPITVPARTEVSAQPNGIAIRSRDGALFLTDDRSNAILTSSDRSSWAPYVSLPTVAGQPNGLSQIVFAQGGTLLAARFGFGEAGGLFAVSASRDVQALTGLATDRRRLGLVSIGPGRVLSSWFVKQESQPAAGGVSLVTYDSSTHAATEHDLIAGLAKPVGIAVYNDSLFVADQTKSVILRYDLSALLAAPAPTHNGTTVARVESPDLLAVDRSGTLYTKCHTHGFCRIAPDGTVTSLADDFQDARGVAIDETRHVLYVVDRAKSSSGAASAVRTFPLKGN